MARSNKLLMAQLLRRNCQRRVKQPERDECIKLIGLIRALQEERPELELLHHIPNGGARSARAGYFLKCMGVRPGIPDYHLPVARGGYHSLYIEMKTDQGRLSGDQEETMKALAREGNLCLVAYGAEDALEIIMDYVKS